MSSCHPFLVSAVLGALLTAALSLPGEGASRRPVGAPTASLRTLIVGGGPDVTSNAAQIEGHVRFVASILPPTAKRVVLFADGDVKRPTVAYADPSASGDARRTLAVLLADEAGEPIQTRAPNLGVPVEGPSTLEDLRRALARLAPASVRAPTPLLLYFAGHGTQNEANEGDTAYNLWNGEDLTVRTLAAELARLPSSVPVVLVMAQCYSGAFADLLFRGGDPHGSLTDRNFVGFFSTRKDREASGCSYATAREDYQDFSSYFFGALSGQDRFGNAVEGADFDRDGTVNLHEAFCYALIHDASADTPVCTSQVFLNRFAAVPDAEIFGVPYGEVSQEGTAAQRAALDAMSQQLDLTGDKRALAVYDRLTYRDPAARPSLVQRQGEAKARLNAAREAALAALFARWPALRWGENSRAYREATAGAVDELAGDPALCRTVLEAEKAREEADEAVSDEEAALQRFAGLYGQVVEARHLHREAKGEVATIFEHLWKAEQAVVPTSKEKSGAAAAEAFTRRDGSR